MDNQKQQGNQQQQKDFGNQPNRGQEQGHQPGHQGNQPGQGQHPNKGQEQPNQPRRENEQQPTKR